MEELLIPAKAKNVDGKFTKNDVLSVSGEFGIVNQIALQGKSSAGESVLPYSVVNWGDAVYTKSPLKEAPYGIIKVNQGRAGIVSTLYAVYTLRQHLIVPVFLELYFDSNVRLNNYLKPLVNKGAKNDMKVKNVDVLKGHIHITPNVVEQARIAEFFRVLDDRIAAAKKKADLLNLKKRYYLQAIFSQQLRFKGFTEPWQQRKLGDLLKFERPDRYIEPDGDYLSEGTTPVLTANKGFVLGYTNNSEGIYDKGACIIFDDFTLDRKLVRRPFKVRSSAIKILTANPSMDLYFIFELLEFQKFPSLGHARHYISVVEPWRAPVPDCSEQTHIGEMFRMMDDLIVAVTRKIELLERRKTAYLQRLFV